MSWTTLALGHQSSDVAVIAAALAAVVASVVRPLFRWLEFRAFMRMWQEIARRDSDMRWIPYFSHAMAAFRYRGKAANGVTPAEHGNVGFPVQGENPTVRQDEPAYLAGLSWHTAQVGNGKACVRVASQGGSVFISDSKHPDGPVLTCSSVEWNLLVEGIRKGEFDDLLG